MRICKPRDVEKNLVEMGLITEEKSKADIKVEAGTTISGSQETDEFKLNK